MSGPVPSSFPGPPARRQGPGGSRINDGSKWRIGTDAEVAWIANGTSAGRTITAAIPPVFEAYATVVLPDGADGPEEHGRAVLAHDRTVLALLAEHWAGQPWWLGYLDTGADDIVFPDAPMVTLYSGWHYVLVEAGPEQAGTWRRTDLGSFWSGVLPNLMFPADHSWLVSALWDDDWTCVGGPVQLVDRFLRHPGLQARSVALGQDATPPGHQAF
jgi:hypothetical protein